MLLRRLSLACLCALLPHCSDDPPAAPAPTTPPPAQQDPQAAAQENTPTPATAAAPLEEETVSFMYSPVGKRDPFRSYLADLAEASKQGNKRRVRETEKYELDQFRLTALVTGTSQPRAMVEDPNGKGHVVKIGMPIGKNGGRVTRITNDAIVVTEEFFDPTGRKVRVPITIKLPKPELKLDLEEGTGG